MALVVINLYQQSKRVIDCGFIPHGIYIHPKDKYRVYCFERDGKNACIINLKTEQVEMTFNATDVRKFSGYATFNQKGDRIYVIEYDQQNFQGSISVFNANDLTVIKQLPTLGLRPESCQLLADSILVINNTGSSQDGFHTPSLVFIDMNSEKLVKRIRLDKPGLNAKLFDIVKPTSVVVSGPTDTAKDQEPGISFIHQDDSVTTSHPASDATKPDSRQPSSMAVDDKQQTVAVTYPDANLLTTWSVEKQSLVKSISMDRPQGIVLSLDNQYYIVSYGRTPSMIKLATATLEPVAESYVQPTFMYSSYLLNWSAELRRVMPGHVYD
jgi:hypothetical protein